MLARLYDMRRDDRGFTLIELMVVVAIILVLIILLFPALRGARQRANDSGAAAYLREAATYMEQYNVDNNTYAGATYANLTGLGLKPTPTAITFSVVATSAGGYCMTATHTGGTGVVFGVTSAAFTRAACTAAQ